MRVSPEIVYSELLNKGFCRDFQYGLLWEKTWGGQSVKKMISARFTQILLSGWLKLYLNYARLQTKLTDQIRLLPEQRLQRAGD